MADKLPVCPHCGSKRVVEVQNFYRCEDCNQDFGRAVSADDGTLLKDAVKGLRFRYGDIVNGSVRLRIVQDETECLYEVYDANGGGVDKVADVLSLADWQDMKEKLFDKMFVADWQKVYIPRNDGTKLLDNNEWELDLDVNDDETISICGYDDEPVYWNALMRIIRPFFKKLEKE